MKTPGEQHASVSEQLVERILALIPTHPEIVTMSSAWDLFKVPGFDVSDLDPSLAQASFALSDAKRRYRSSNP